MSSTVFGLSEMKGTPMKFRLEKAIVKFTPWILSLFLWILAGIPHSVRAQSLSESSIQTNAVNTGLIADSVQIQDRKIKAAVELWQKYREAVVAGDMKKIKTCWTAETYERGSMYDRRFDSFQKYRTTIRNLTSTIAAATKMDADCIRLTLHWRRNAATKPVFTETLYVLSEGGRPMLAHALEAMTRHWPGRQTKCIQYRYYPDHRFNAKTAAVMDSFTLNLYRLFQLRPARKIPYYIFPPKSDPVNFQQWNVSRTDLGEAEGRISMVIDWIRDSEYSPHEITHIVQHQLTENVPCLFLLEGMATYYGGDNTFREAVLNAFKKTMANNAVPPVDSLIRLSYSKGELTRKEDLWIRGAGAAVVGYLVERHSADAFKRFYVDASAKRNDKANSQNFVASLKNTYQLTPPELDVRYRTWLMAREK